MRIKYSSRRYTRTNNQTKYLQAIHQVHSQCANPCFFRLLIGIITMGTHARADTIIYGIILLYSKSLFYRSPRYFCLPKKTPCYLLVCANPVHVPVPVFSGTRFTGSHPSSYFTWGVWELLFRSRILGAEIYQNRPRVIVHDTRTQKTARILTCIWSQKDRIQS